MIIQCLCLDNGEGFSESKRERYSVVPTKMNNVVMSPALDEHVAKLVTGVSSRKSVNLCTLTALVGNGADVAIPLESIRAISEQFVNLAFGFFLGKRVAYPFSSEDGLDAMLKNGLWSSYARAMIDLRADEESKDSIMVAMLKLVGERFDMCTNLNNPRQATRGVLVGPNVSFKSTKQITVLGSFPPLFTPVATTADNALGKSSYANFTGKPSGKKLNIHTLFTPGGNGMDVVVPVESIQAISEQFANTVYGFFLGKRVAYPVVANYVRNTWGKFRLVRSMFSSSTGLFSFQFSSMEGLDAMLENVWVKHHDVPVTAFSEDGLSVIATKLGTPLMLDSYTSDMCAGEKKTLKKPSQTSRGVPIGPKMGFKPQKEYRPVPKKHTASSSGKKMKAWNLLLSNVGIVVEDNLLVWQRNSSSSLCIKLAILEIYQVLRSLKDEVASVDNDMARSMASERPFDVLNSIENDDDLSTNGGNSKSAGKGSLNVAHGSSSNTPIIDKTDKLEHQLIDGKLRFVDDDRNPIGPTGNVDSDSEVEVVFDETTNLMDSTSFKGGSDRESKERDAHDDNGWTWVIGKHNKHLRSHRKTTSGNHFSPPQTQSSNTHPTTYYFTNFPTNWDNRTMLEIFKRYGEALSVYIPKKRNKEGKRFGLCRFSGVSNHTAFERRLNTICIGTKKITCNLARHQRKPVRQTHTSPKPNHTPHGRTYSSKPSFADVLAGKKNLDVKLPIKIQLNYPSSPTYNSLHSIFVELKSIVGASNTHHLLLDQGFKDFSIKYMGGLHLLIKFSDQSAVDNALNNNDLISHFNSMVPRNLKTRIKHRLVWLSISGLPPQLWYPDSFSAIAEHYGRVLLPEDCSPRQFNITYRQVCILLEHLDFINDTLLIPFNNEVLSVRAMEIKGETDSLFNGYVFSNRLELGIFEAEPGGNEPEDEIHGDNSGNDSNSEKESNSNEDSDTGNEISLSDDFSKNCHIVVNDRKVCPSNVNVKSLSGDVSTSHARFRVNDKTPLSYRPLKPKLNRASSVPPPSLHGNNTTYRRKRFASFRLIDPMNGINDHLIQSCKNRKHKQILTSQPIAPSPTSLSDNDASISDSLSKIQRCNFRILSRNKATNSSESFEVDNIVNLGNQIGFDMRGKQADVSRVINNGVTMETSTAIFDYTMLKGLWNNSSFDYVFQKSVGKSGGILAIWDTSSFQKFSWLEGDEFLAIKGTWLPIDTACLFIVVYAPQCIHKKKALWDALNLIISSHDCLTIILGDYNEVRNESERAGSIFCPRGANLFKDFISLTGLHKIPMGDNGLHG
ncbi:cytochrome P450 [Tanacetum coccineum]